MVAVTDDPVLERRAHIARAVSIGQRVGVALFGVAVALFMVGAVGDFTATLVSVIVVCLVAGSIVLAPAIVFGYAVKAAARDDAERGIGP